MLLISMTKFVAHLCDQVKERGWWKLNIAHLCEQMKERGWPTLANDFGNSRLNVMCLNNKLNLRVLEHSLLKESSMEMWQWSQVGIRF